MNKKEIFIEELKKIIGSADFDLWFRPSVFDFSQEEENSIITIITPYVYIQDNIKTKFLNKMKDLYDGLFHKKIWFDFKVERKKDNLELELEQPAPTYELTKTNEGDSVDGFKNSVLNPKYTFENFIVGDSNQFARAAAWAVATNPGKQFNPLFIYGGSGLGKTHLMQAIGHYVIKNFPKLKVLYITSEEFTNKFINALTQKKTHIFREKFHQIDLLLIDDIQFLIGKEQTQEVFFHTFNSLHSSGRQLVISSDKPPKDLLSFEDRLKNRMEWGLQADIQPPRFETRLAILKQQNEQLNANINIEVLEFIAEHFTSDVRELEGAFNKVFAFSHTYTEINLSVCRNIFKDIIEDKKIVKNVSIKKIIKTVCKYYNIDYDLIMSNKRDQPITFARQLAMYLCKEISDYPYKFIGKEFNKDHSTVIHSFKKIQEMLNTDTGLLENINLIKKNILNDNDFDFE